MTNEEQQRRVHFVDTLNANVNNEKLSDSEIRCRDIASFSPYGCGVDPYN